MNSEKNNLGLGVLIGFLCLIIGILGGYIISNNVSSKKSDSSSINSNDVNYADWMNYILKQDIKSITLSRTTIDPEAEQTNNTKVYLTVDQLKDVFSKFNSYNLVKTYLQGKGSSRDSLIISYSIEGINYDVKIEDAFISTNISDSSFLSALESSKHSEGEFIEGANYAYVFKDYNSSILDEYFKKDNESYLFLWQKLFFFSKIIIEGSGIMKGYNKKRLFLLVMVIVLIISCIFGFIFIKFKSLDIKYDKNVIVNLNDEVYDIDNITILKNGSFVNDKVKLDTSKVGVQEVMVIIKDSFNRNKKISYKLEVKDNEGPVINYKNLSTQIGKDIDLLAGVSALDNSGESISVSVEGDYDINTIGDYNLYYVASDSSGNTTRDEFTLTVKQKRTSGYQIMPDREFKTLKGFPAKTKDGFTYVDGYLIVNKTYSIPSTYNPGLDKDVQAQADIMFADAKALGLNIYISSGFRSFSYQTTLYNRYVSQDGKEMADTYSARPGHSEHQTGLAFDVNQIDNSFADTPEGKWMANNCYKYGFILRYPKGKTNETGYMYESWHFRYVGKELAEKLYNNGDWITMESYFGLTSEYDY